MEKTNGANSRINMKNIKTKFVKLLNKLIYRKGWILQEITNETNCTSNVDDKIVSGVYNFGIPKSGIFYHENNEVGCRNLSEKLDRVRNNGPFEWPNMVALNQAIACFIGDSKKIVNIGSGTGTFEWFVSVDSTLKLIASEYDLECVEWCKKNRQRDNILYCSKSMNELINEYGKFDLAITVDVIEHVSNYPQFLHEFSKLADRAIITTPNKDRTYEDSICSPPSYYQHVREWDAGEFYWVLKVFYKQVKLYAMQDVYIPYVEKIGLLSTMTPLIAICQN
jgi:2-polyprenyl-3-methyl-5-hydroxy-6-metoxy-1,4-benzoquinol methylase